MEEGTNLVDIGASCESSKFRAILCAIHRGPDATPLRPLVSDCL